MSHGSPRREVKSNSKMQDVEEFKRWHADGKPYSWMVKEYQRKYGIDTTVAMFTNYATRIGLPKRARKAATDTLPWAVKPEHQKQSEINYVRALARNEAGLPPAAGMTDRLNSWKEYLTKKGWVLHYEPDTDEGFFYVDARPGIDTGFVRNPRA